MIRLVATLYILLLLVMGLGLAVPHYTSFLYWKDASEVVQSNFSGPLKVTKRHLETADDPELEILRIQRLFEHPVELLYFGAKGAPFWLRSKYAGNRVWLEPNSNGGVTTYLKYDDKRLIKYGPLPPVKLTGKTSYYISFGLLVIGGFFILLFMVRPLVRQSRVLSTAAKEISAGYYGTRIKPKAVPHSPKVVEAFNRMTAQVEQLLVSHRQLLQDVSHELRTPLARVRFGLEILNDENTGPKDRRRISEKLDQSIQQLDHLVEELLQYTRLADQKNTPIDESPVNITDLLQAVIERFAFIEEEGKTITTQFPAEALPRIPGNSRELVRAFDNLLANATRFAEQKVVLRTKISGNFISIAVADDGPGIPEEKRERIFQPFVQLERSTHHNGLGLAIVARIVESHRGELLVGEDNELGGAVITMKLPVLDQ
jgi:signal transduction histidine kinase